MEKGKPTKNAEQPCENIDMKNEAEQYDYFINAIVRIVEKYGKSVLQDLDCVA